MKKIYDILILDTGKEWGGGTNSLIELLKRIDRKKYNFTVLFYYNYNKGNDSNIQKEIEKLGIKFVLLPQKSQAIFIKIIKEVSRILFFYSKKIKKIIIFWIDYFYKIKPNAKRIAKIIKDLKIDLLYMNNQPSSNLEGIIASKITGIPSVLHCRVEPVLNFFEAKLTNSSVNKIICVSAGVKNELIKQNINTEKCIVVYDGIDIAVLPKQSLQTIRKKIEASEKEIAIGTVGSLMKRKKISDLIEVFSIVRSKIDNEIKLIIVGEGPEKENLVELAKRKNLINDIIFTGFQNDAISYINAFDIFVMTSDKEGLPRVILEAMLMAKPVVASNIPGISELVINGETGFLVPPKNPEAFAEKILFLINNPDLRKQIGEKGRERVINHFSIERYVRGVEKVFEEVLKV